MVLCIGLPNSAQKRPVGLFCGEKFNQDYADAGRQVSALRQFEIG
jgi:hypothetical protein